MPLWNETNEISELTWDKRERRIAELEDACRRALKIIEPNYLHQREKVADGIDILKRVLETNQED